METDTSSNAVVHVWGLSAYRTPKMYHISRESEHTKRIVKRNLTSNVTAGIISTLPIVLWPMKINTERYLLHMRRAVKTSF